MMIRINTKTSLLIIFSIAMLSAIVKSHIVAEHRRDHEKQIESTIRLAIRASLLSYNSSVQLPRGGQPTYEEAEDRVRKKYKQLLTTHPKLRELLIKLRSEYDAGVWESGDALRELVKSKKCIVCRKLFDHF